MGNTQPINDIPSLSSLMKAKRKVLPNIQPISKIPKNPIPKRKESEDTEYRNANIYALRRRQLQLLLATRINNQTKPQVNEDPKPPKDFQSVFRIQEEEAVVTRSKRAVRNVAAHTFDKGSDNTKTYMQNQQLYKSTNDYALIKPTKYETENDQPIEVNLSLESLLLMTIHSHLY